MSEFEEIKENDDDLSPEIDDNELDNNELVFFRPDKNLMPKLSLEREVSVDEVQKAIEQFPRNFAYVYPSAGPAICMRPLDQVMKQSIFNSDERRPLLVYLHRNGTAATHVFCKQVLCNDDIIDYLGRYYLFWAWDCTEDANYSRFLLMLLQHTNASVTSMVAAVPLEEYPLLICLLSEQNQINVIKVIENPDDTVSLDEIYIHLIEICKRFHNPSKEILHTGSQHLPIRFAEDWAPPPSQLILLDQQTDKFRDVAKYFTDGPGRILSIQEITNDKWLTKYQEKKRIIDACMGHDQTERILFHGCLRAASQAILEHGFSHNLIGIHGKQYGHGYYLSSNPVRSHVYALPNLSSGGERTMLLCCAIIGRTCCGDSTMVTCPPRYNSATDRSQMYVIFSNEQILPKYLITYK